MDKQKLLIGSMVVLAAMTAGVWLMKPDKNGPTPHSDTTNWNWSNSWNNSPQTQPIVPPQQVQPTPPPSATPTTPPPSNQTTAEPRTYEDALKISAASGKQILIYFSAPWCHYCNEMKQETLSSPQVQEALKKYVYLQLNKDLHPALARKFNVSGIPAYVIINSQEQVLRREVGKKSPSDFTAWLSGS